MHAQPVPVQTMCAAAVLCNLPMRAPPVGAVPCKCFLPVQVTLHARLVIDAMGSFSPIAAQARGGVKPDSVVLMVGSCSRGLPPCSTADLLYSFTPIDV